MREIMSEGSNRRPLVIIDHQGAQGLDAATYFKGHGLENVRCLRGGIDAWRPKWTRKSEDIASKNKPPTSNHQHQSISNNQIQ